MPRFSLRPLAARAFGRVRRLDLRGAAYRTVELAPAEISDRPPALALPDEFERARGFFVDRDFERGRVLGGQRPEGATIAYELHDALLADGTLYAGLAYDALRPGGGRFSLSERPRRIAEAALTTSVCAESFFGDWLIEGLSLELLAAERGWPVVSPERRDWLHEPGYRELTGLAPSRTAVARFDRLWVIDDRGINAGRGARLRELRRRIAAAAAAGPTDGSEATKVYLTRGTLGTGRAIRNDAEVQDALRRRGFAIVHPEAETPLALVRHLRDARVAMCLEGSAQQHAVVAMPAGGTILNVQPPDRFTAQPKDLTDHIDLRYAYLVGEPEGNGFSVDLARLHATLDLIGA